MLEQDWRSYKLRFGKHKGDTMYIVYINDYSYITWLREQAGLQDDLKTALDNAIEHKNKTDPWSK